MLSNACSAPQATILTLRRTLSTIAESQRRHADWHRQHLSNLSAQLDELKHLCRVLIPESHLASPDGTSILAWDEEALQDSSPMALPMLPASTLQMHPAAIVPRQELEALAASLVPDRVSSISAHVITQLLTIFHTLLSSGKASRRANAILVLHEIVCQHPATAVPLAVSHALDVCVHDGKVLAELTHRGVPLDRVLELHRILCPK